MPLIITKHIIFSSSTSTFLTLNSTSTSPRSSSSSSSSYFLILSLFSLILISTMSSSCRVDICSREYSYVHDYAQSNQQSQSQNGKFNQDQFCSLLNIYQNCVKSVGTSCRGHLSFHTIQTLLRNWKTQFNCTHGSSNNNNNNHGVKKPYRVPPNQRKIFPNQQIDYQQKFIYQQQQRLQNCLAAAYNYTINSDSNSDTLSSSRDERIKLVPSITDSDINVNFNEQIDKNGLTTSSSSSLLRGQIKRSKVRVTREKISPPTYNKNPLKSFLMSDEDEENDNENDNDEDNEDETDDSENDNNNNSNNNNNNNNNSEGNNFSTTESQLPYNPPSPPLTCIIYGDPHLKTLDNQYQTCKCNGAWPLIDHPLFAVQITNSRFQDSSSPQITGVTKVTVLVRQFTKCGIHNDLLYEAESGSNHEKGFLPATFIDSSSSTSNNLIRITRQSNTNVVTIHLDHIGVRVYIGQLTSSKYLNIVIKFRSATSTVKQQLVLKSISANSLCKSGCPQRERIDIKSILQATGVNYETVTPKEVNNLDDLANTRVILSNDAPTNKDSDDPCRGLYGFYRISCLYDMAIKGIKDVNNACRFAQSFDEFKSINYFNPKDTNSLESFSQSDVQKINYSSRIVHSTSLLYILFYIIMVYYNYFNL